MPNFIDDTNSHTLNGTYIVGSGGVFIPSGATVQEFGTTESSLVWIEPSGQFAIYEATSGWMMSSVMDAPDALAPSIDPDDAGVVDALYFWGNNNTLEVATPGQSGLSNWNDGGGQENHMVDVNTPTVASGAINGLDTAYLVAGSTQYFQDGGSIQNGANVPISCIAVVKPESLQEDCIFSACHSSQDSASMWTCWTLNDGGIRLYKVSNLGAATDYRVGSYSAGELMCLSWIDTGTEIRMYKNGVEITAAASGSATSVFANQQAVGAWAKQTPGNYWNGHICEIAVYSSGVDTTNRPLIEAGLMQKWGIS